MHANSCVDMVHFLNRSTLSSCFSFRMLRMHVSAKRSLGKRSTKTPSRPWPSGLNNCSSRWRWPNSHLTVLCSTTFKTPRISNHIRLRSPLAFGQSYDRITKTEMKVQFLLQTGLRMWDSGNRQNGKESYVQFVVIKSVRSQRQS